MKISLKRTSGRYGFDILTDLDKVIYSSDRHYFLTPSIKSSYKYAWQACKDAWKLALKRPHHIIARYDLEDPSTVEVSAESMLTTHYVTVLRDMRIRAKGIGHKKDEREELYNEIKMVITELKAVQEQMTSAKEKNKIIKILKQYELLIQKYFQLEKQKDKQEAPLSPKIASIVEPESEIDTELIGNVLDTYAEKACKAIQDKHDDAYYAIAPNNKEITIYNFDNSPLLKLKVNDNLSVESIIPVGELYKNYPLHSVNFYQKYWKPIAESLGHFYASNSNLLLKIDSTTLPDTPKSDESYPIEGWDTKEKKDSNINISFKGEKPTWVLKQVKNVKLAQQESKYTEQDYMNSIVKCIDPNLKSINGRSGTVIQVIPTENMVEIDVDFGRGLDVVRLTEKQIEIVPIGV
jgi:hypothetical protein